jgi:hypothetical protein
MYNALGKNLSAFPSKSYRETEKIGEKTITSLNHFPKSQMQTTLSIVWCAETAKGWQKTAL